MCGTRLEINFAWQWVPGSWVEDLWFRVFPCLRAETLGLAPACPWPYIGQLVWRMDGWFKWLISMNQFNNLFASLLKNVLSQIWSCHSIVPTLIVHLTKSFFDSSAFCSCSPRTLLSPSSSSSCFLAYFPCSQGSSCTAFEVWRVVVVCPPPLSAAAQRATPTCTKKEVYCWSHGLAVNAHFFNWAVVFMWAM